MIEPLYDSPFYGLKVTNKFKVDEGTLGGMVRYKVCYLCKKKFPIYCEDTKYCYRIGSAKTKHNEQKLFCSWTCLRKYQREHTERRQHQGSPRVSWRENRDTVLKRIHKCAEKIEAYTAAMEEEENTRERYIAQKSLNRWKDSLKEAQEYLEQMGGESE